MADNQTQEKVREAQRRLEIAAYEDEAVVPVYAEDLRTLLAAYTTAHMPDREAEDILKGVLADRDAEAAEATIASLTGQVGEMRERIADLERDMFLECGGLDPSPPGISTTGGDGASPAEPE